MKTLEYSQGIGGPLFLWGTDLSRGKELEELKSELDGMIPGQAYTLAAYGVEDWNGAFSPWEAEVEGQRFDGRGTETLAWLKKEYLPYLAQKYPECREKYIVGYSLAGLFALWAACETDLFSGCACCSGSLWFPGWTDYAEHHSVCPGTRIYLSLGGKEKNSRSAVLSTIEDNTKRQLSLLKERTAVVTLEMNPGGHFVNPVNRLAKGIVWLQKNGR